MGLFDIFKRAAPAITTRQLLRPGDPSLPTDSGACLEAISGHIERYWGTTGPVYHEKVSDYVHVDVHVVKATADRPYHSLITSGMSDRPMTTRAGSEGCQYAEVLLALPPSWPLDVESFLDPRYYWPIRLLKEAARFPHIAGTFLWSGHTFANGHPPQPYVPEVPFTASMIVPPALVPVEAHVLRVSPEKEIHFHAIVPIFPEEHERAREMGLSMLRSAMKGRVNELIDVKRQNYGDVGTFMREMMPPLT